MCGVVVAHRHANHLGLSLGDLPVCQRFGDQYVNAPTLGSDIDRAAVQGDVVQLFHYRQRHEHAAVQGADVVG
ncbi:hypothetical protein D9M70_463450 [compost metagenome]